MLKSKMARFSAVALIGLASVLATEARAQTPVTLPATALIATNTFTSGFLNVTAGFDNLPVPHDVPCPSPATGTCSEYTYRFTSTGGNISKAWLSVSSDVAIYEASVTAPIASAGSVFIMECIADETPSNGLTACAQREVRFSPNQATFDAKLVVSRSAPRVATASAFAAFQKKFGLIQGPGVIGGTIAPITFKSKLLVANGHCPVDVTNGPDGGFTSLANSLGSPCTTTISNVAPLIDEVTGQPVQISPGEFVTYGTDSCALTLIQGKYYNICR